MTTNRPIAVAFAAALIAATGCATTETAYETVVDGADAAWGGITENWADFRTAASDRWDRLTSDDLDDIDGDRDELIDDVAEYYGISEEEAARQVDDWAVTQG